MTPEAAFVHAVHDCPEDRLTYAAYADWLEEAGDPRAEIVHSLLAIRDGGATPAQVQTLFDGNSGARLRRLAEAGEIAPDPRGLVRLHLADSSKIDADEYPDTWSWVTEVVVSEPDLLPQLPRVGQRLPLLSRVVLQVAAGTLGTWAVSGGLHCRPFAIRLELVGHRLTWLDLPRLGALVPAGWLRELSLRRSLQDESQLELLTHIAVLRDLRRLELDDNPIGPHGAHWLAGLTLAGLEVLSLEDTRVNDGGVAALLAAEGMPALGELRLTGTPLSLTGLGTWLGSRWAPRGPVSFETADFSFRQTPGPAGPRLSLRLHRLRPAWVDAFLRFPVPDGLAGLELRPGCHWRPDDLAEILALPELHSLRSLALGDAEAHSVREILASPVAGTLEEMTLHGWSLDNAALRPLLDGPGLPRLRKLTAVTNRVRPTGPLVVALRQRYGTVEIGGGV